MQERLSATEPSPRSPGLLKQSPDTAQPHISKTPSRSASQQCWVVLQFSQNQSPSRIHHAFIQMVFPSRFPHALLSQSNPHLCGSHQPALLLKEVRIKTQPIRADHQYQLKLSFPLAMFMVNALFFLLPLTAIASPLENALQSRAANPKRGIAYPQEIAPPLNRIPGGSAISWEYNWGKPAPGGLPSGIQHVPMQWDERDIDNLVNQIGGASVLLVSLPSTSTSPGPRMLNYLRCLPTGIQRT